MHIWKLLASSLHLCDEFLVEFFLAFENCNRSFTSTLKLYGRVWNTTFCYRSVFPSELLATFYICSPRQSQMLEIYYLSRGLTESITVFLSNLAKGKRTKRLILKRYATFSKTLCYANALPEIHTKVKLTMDNFTRAFFFSRTQRFSEVGLNLNLHQWVAKSL